jgi:hypothetical protein
VSDEFDAIAPREDTLELSGASFRIAPITVDLLPPFARALRPIMPVLTELAQISDDADPTYVADTLLELITDSGEQIHEAVAVAVAQDKAQIAAARARVGALNAADFVVLTMRVLKVNADFFARRLLPLLSQAAREARAVVGAGPTPSAP